MAPGQVFMIGVPIMSTYQFEIISIPALDPMIVPMAVQRGFPAGTGGMG